jgi:hypothetical protein
MERIIADDGADRLRSSRGAHGTRGTNVTRPPGGLLIEETAVGRQRGAAQNEPTTLGYATT